MATAGNTLFEDAIISATDLKNNQKKWFDQAVKSPVSITNRGGRQLVLVNRDQMRSLVMSKYHAERILKFFQELRAEEQAGKFESLVFPWAAHLSAADRREFQAELVSSFTELIYTGNWSALDEIVSSWQATSEALTNPRFMEVVRDGASKRKYVRVG